MKSKIILILSAVTLCVALAAWTNGTAKKKPATIGVYYFDGWAGKNRHADKPEEPWAKNAPTHLTRRFVEEFPGREPVWGWRDDDLAIMERQIDLAADNGVDFFLFCWYWRDNKGPINIAAIENDHHHKSMELYLKAKNKHRVKFALLVANHGGFEILGTENWQAGVKYWSKFFKDPQYIKVDKKPLLVLFGSRDITNDDLADMQDVAKREGLKKGLSIAGCGGAAKEKSGFNYSTHYNVTAGGNGRSEEHKYIELVEANKKAWGGTEQQPYIPIITVGWDKRPWEGPKGLGQNEGWYYTGESPEIFRNYLASAIDWMNANPQKTTKEKVVLIYAWNELGEGGYLVPTKDDPDAAKLKVIKEIAGK